MLSVTIDVSHMHICNTKPNSKLQKPLLDKALGSPLPALFCWTSMVFAAFLLAAARLPVAHLPAAHNLHGFWLSQLNVAP